MDSWVSWEPWHRAQKLPLNVNLCKCEIFENQRKKWILNELQISSTSYVQSHLSSDKMLIHFVIRLWWNFCFGQRSRTDQCQNIISGSGWSRWTLHTATRTARRPPRPPARVPRHRREVHPRPPWSNMERLSFLDTTGLCRRVSILETFNTILSMSQYEQALQKRMCIHTYLLQF